MPMLPISVVRSRAALGWKCALFVAVGGPLLALGCGQSPANPARYWDVVDSSAPATTAGAAGSGGRVGPGDLTGVAGTGGVPGSGNPTGGTSTGGTSTGGTSTSGNAGTGGTGGSTVHPPGGSGGSPVMDGGTGNAALPGSLTVTVTTKPAGGQYQPNNVGAIWIADGSDKFIKTLDVWGSLRRLDLTHWLFATGLTSNTTDAITAATYRSHGTRMASWNGTDASRAPVPDGAYKVCFELADGASAYQCVDFTKGRAHQSLSPPDNSSFTQRTIEYTP